MTEPPTDRRAFLKTAAALAGAVAIEPEVWPPLWQPPAPVRIALVGCGRQGRAILGELAKFETVQVAALCDVDASRLDSSLRRAQGAKGHASVDSLVAAAADFDVVVVATPTHRHKEPALAALAAKKHVFCEAPLAHTLDDCRAIAKAARASGKVFHTGMQGRSNPIYALARSFVVSGSIRDVVALRAQYRKKTSWQTPAPDASREREVNWRLDPEVSLGLFGEIGSHQLDVVHWFLGRYPTAVRMSGAVLGWPDGRQVADTVHGELRFGKDLRLAYEATLANSLEGQYELFVGTMGAVKLAWTAGWLFKEADAPTQGWEVYANRQQFHNDEGITLIAEATKLAAQGKLKEGVGLPQPPLYYALADFLKSVTEGKPVVCTAEEGLRAAVVAIEARRAMQEGGEVTIDEALYKVD